MRFVARRNGVHHEDARVCRSDEEYHNHQERKHTEGSGKWELLKEGKQQYIRIVGKFRERSSRYILVYSDGSIA